jgi:hypothetical protein
VTDFVDALQAELRRAAERRARGGVARRLVLPRVLPGALAAAALAIGLALVLVVRPAGEERRGPAGATTTAPAASIPADVSPGALRSKRFGRGARVGTSAGVPVYADVDRWRYCPRDPLRLRTADVRGAQRAAVAIVARLTALDTYGARSLGGRIVTGNDYAVHQCGTAMRRHAVGVSIALPRQLPSASLSQLGVVVARTRAGWVVFDRPH